MAAFQPDVDQAEVFLDGFGNVEWADDVTAYSCTRCRKVLVQHYISNCGHKFCSNCKRVMDDGSHRWRCPNCREYIRDIERQDFEFRDRVFELRLHCPNRNYGCGHIGPFKGLREHLAGCEHTREKALPVLYEGGLTLEMLERMFSMQLLQLRNEMKEMREEMGMRVVHRGVDEEQKGVNESAWALSLEVNRMKREMGQMTEKQKKGKGKIKTKLFLINNRVDGVKSDLHVETTRLRNEIKEVQKQPMASNSSEGLSLTVEENRAKISKLESKTDTWVEIMDFNNRKSIESTHKIETELKANQMKIENEIKRIEQTMNETKTRTMQLLKEEKEKREEVTSIVSENSAQIIKLNSKAEILQEEVKENKIKLDEKANKTEVDDQKNHLIEITGNMIVVNKEMIVEINNQMTQQMDKETKKMAAKIEKNKVYAEGKVVELISLLNNTKTKMMQLLKEEKENIEQMTLIVNQNSSRINELNSKAEILRAEVKENKVKLDEKANKTEVEDQKNDLMEIIGKMEVVNKEINNQLTQQIKQEMEKMLAKIEENEAYAEIKAKELISPLSILIEEKVCELNERISKLEETTEQNNQLIKSNKSDQISDLEQKVNNLEILNLLRNPQMSMFTLAENKGNFQPNFTWEIKGIRNMLKKGMFKIKSEVFQWTGYPVRAQAKISLYSSGNVYIKVHLKEDNGGNEIDLKLIPHVYYLLRDQTNTTSPKHMCRSTTHLFTSKLISSIPYFLFICAPTQLTAPPYNANDSVVIEIYVEPPTMAQSVHSYDGTLNWAIDNCRKRIEMEKSCLVWCHESPYFYTSTRGYRVQVEMRLDGLGENKGKELSVGIRFLTGEFDDELPRTFPHRTTITLFNRKDSQRNITKTIVKDIKSNKSYYIDMCSHEEVNNVIENDTLFYKVTIQPSK